MDIIKNCYKPIEEDPNIRKNNFFEVTKTYDESTAIKEANRCLRCENKPCVKNCPVGIDIPGFISLICEKKFEDAYNLISKYSCFPGICGRVCPQETQCEATCTMGIKNESIAIGRLERFVSDYHIKNIKISNPEFISKKNVKIAVVGSGPAGLSFAGEMIKSGFDVTIYEAMHDVGGVLKYGIPSFRLPKDILKYEIGNLINLGVKIEKNVVIGKTITITQLKNIYDYIYISTGAGLPIFMGINGENLNGVYSANEYLTRINLLNANEPDSSTPILNKNNVAVVGGGNVAMDSARCAIRLGAKKVYLIYRRSEEEMPARKEEIIHAKEEGIEFLLLNNPKEILGDENFYVNAIRLVKMELGDPDESGRKKPIEIKGSEYILPIDMVIMALGTSPNPILKNSLCDNTIIYDKKGRIVVDDNNMTSDSKLYAGGDAVTGAATVILAMAAGKNAAKSIIKLYD